MQGLLFSVLLFFAVSAQGTEEWFSIERHGGCVPMSTMAELIEEFQGVQTPDDLAENYRHSGHDVLVQDYRDLLMNEDSTDSTGTLELPPEGTRYIFYIDGNIRWILFEKSQCENIFPYVSDKTLPL